ncbi:hypothetical protein E2562_022287 [Oryza meyeriana var. granulata]|uniref:Uncharacterized protein n=1 Tax=Oryza meyeriana var. granulata TaxID=110450 RepID=A0A6G1D4X4_9ORYZ|nr:hypothetical protein E2562_022287 [Oryza meyeriana var. granulata]KAF0907885.1 hypothetical protein E2562_022287 [Oryza meyeriana var. granulata]
MAAQQTKSVMADGGDGAAARSRPVPTAQQMKAVGGDAWNGATVDAAVTSNPPRAAIATADPSSSIVVARQIWRGRSPAGWLQPASSTTSDDGGGSGVPSAPSESVNLHSSSMTRCIHTVSNCPFLHTQMYPALCSWQGE